MRQFLFFFVVSTLWVYSGQEGLDPCNPYINPCHTEAECSVDGADAVCTCKPGFVGDGRTSGTACVPSLVPGPVNPTSNNSTSDNSTSTDVTIECSDASMSITILNEGYDNVTFALSNASCIFTNNGTHNTITIDYDTCGTTLTEESDHLVYSNRAETSKESGAVITRDPDHYVTLVCKLERSVNITMTDRLNVTNSDSINITKDGTTTFTVNLKVYPTPQFSGSPYTAGQFPLELSIRDVVNIEINLDTSNEDVKLVTQSCYATPTSSPSDATKHYILQNRCGTDTTYDQYEITQTSLKYSFKAFQFLTTSDVYVHCELVICENSSSTAECSFCGGSRRKRRDTMDYSDEEVMDDETLEKYTVTSRRIILITEENTSETKASPSTNNTILFATLTIGLLIVLAIIFAVVIVYRMKLVSQGNHNQKMNMKVMA